MTKYAHINYAENMLLSHPNARSKTKKAVICAIEPPLGFAPEERISAGHIRDLTFDELYIEVAQAASGLKKLGVGQGDRVAALTPNNAEAIIMLLATASLGAIWSSSPPEFGVSAITDRFTQVRLLGSDHDIVLISFVLQLKPKVLISADKYRVNGKDHDILAKVAEAVRELTPLGLKAVILVGHTEKDRRIRAELPRYDNIQTLHYGDFLDKNTTEVHFNRVPAASPLWVLYSSGTSMCCPSTPLRASLIFRVCSWQAKSHSTQSFWHVT